MKTQLQERRAKRLERVFRKYGKESRHVRLDVPSKILDRCQFSDEEIPVVFAAGEAGDWIALGTDSLAFGRSLDESFRFHFNEVDEVSVDVRREAARRNHHKMDWSSLRLMLTDGRSYSLDLEAGPGFWGILNALKSAVDQHDKK